MQFGALNAVKIDWKLDNIGQVDQKRLVFQVFIAERTINKYRTSLKNWIVKENGQVSKVSRGSVWVKKSSKEFIFFLFRTLSENYQQGFHNCILRI